MTPETGKRSGRFIKSKRFYVLIFLCLGFILLHSCMQFRTSDRATLKHFEELNVEVSIDHISIEGYQHSIRVISAGNSEKNTIFFIHGTPGSADAFYSYLKDSTLLKNARLITYDRPGYGYSAFGNSMVSIEQQADVAAKVLDAFDANNVTVVGHSYGGTIAAYLPLLSKRIKNVLLLAPALDPDHEKYFWIGNFAKWHFTRWMVPTSWKVSADEKYAHEEELRNVEHAWEKVSVPVVDLHGSKDRLVPFENLKFAESHFNTNYFTGTELPGKDHFIPWTDKEIVISTILKLLK